MARVAIKAQITEVVAAEETMVVFLHANHALMQTGLARIHRIITCMGLMVLSQSATPCLRRQVFTTTVSSKDKSL